eukprot:Pgem_evm1s5371
MSSEEDNFSDSMDESHDEDDNNDSSMDGDDDDDDDFDAIDHQGHNKKHKKCEEHFEYKILSPADLISSQINAIQEVNNIFQIPHSSARILLQHFKWEKQVLMEKYYDNPGKVYAEAGVVDPRSVDDNSNNNNINNTNSESAVRECEICFCPISSTAMYSMACKHTFCNDCWNGYLEAKIMEEGAAQSIECPEGDCNILVDEYTVTQLLQSEKVKKKYELLTAKFFVSGNKRIRWCPAPDCDNASEVVVVEAKPVTCTCGHVYCFNCGEDDHRPLTCPIIKRWLKKCADDSETANWISANTKECPKCQVTVEKSGGCNHM